TAMKLLHPYMPFVTEEIYRYLINDDESIMISVWPVYDESLAFTRDEKDMGLVMDAIKAVRNIKAEMNVPPSKKIKIIFIASESEREILKDGTKFIERLAGASGSIIQAERAGVPDNEVTAVVSGAEIFVALEVVVD